MKAKFRKPKVGIPKPHRGMATKEHKGRTGGKLETDDRQPRSEGGIVLPPEERFFTKPELARVMKVSVRCITDMMRRGELRYLKINGHLVRFRLQDVNQRLSETVLVCKGEVEPRRDTKGHESDWPQKSAKDAKGSNR